MLLCQYRVLICIFSHFIYFQPGKGEQLETVIRKQQRFFCGGVVACNYLRSSNII